MPENDRGAQLVLTRTSPRDIGLRDLYLRINDGPEHRLLYKESLTLPLGPGSHTLRITNRLFSKAEQFSLDAGEVLTYEVANVSAGCLFAPLIVIGGTGAYRVAMRRVE